MSASRSIFALTLAALTVAGCDSPGAYPSREGRDAIVAEVTGVMQDLTRAMNAHDAEEVLAFYGRTEDFTYLGCTEFILGGSAFAGTVAPFYAAHPEVVFEQEIVGVQVAGPDAAVVTQRGASSEAGALFWTRLVLRGEDGRWRIAMEHESWPGCEEPRGPHPFTTAEN
ncbi:MAG: SgcJ/EcaC family oxidoreductase [Gemmatimonadota bacterium]|nr:SgcJ/EcaC family oxidoreductase [Gemmatimonadota bacterium]MDH5757952.1 SgcJ/EcaC family oxidoreductase [Gemmatimonadota bacterium]